MILCMRCGRKMKNPSQSGYGPKFHAAILGPRPKRQAAVKPVRVRHDEQTPDLFEVVV